MVFNSSHFTVTSSFFCAKKVIFYKVTFAQIEKLMISLSFIHTTFTEPPIEIVKELFFRLDGQFNLRIFVSKWHRSEGLFRFYPQRPFRRQLAVQHERNSVAFTDEEASFLFLLSGGRTSATRNTLYSCRGQFSTNKDQK